MEIERCSNCILPTSLPSVNLDENRICAPCRAYERQVADWEANKLQMPKELGNLAKWAKGLQRPYDCLVPLSGGKDSTYALYLCSKVYGLKCICVTFDNGFLSEQAKRNIENAVKSADADHRFFRIERNTMLDLYKLFLKKCGTFCPICMRGIRTSAEETARKFKVPIVVYGGGSRLAYLSFHQELGEGGSLSFCRNVLKNEPIGQRIRRPYLKSVPLEAARVSRVLYSTLRIPMLYALPINLYDYVDITAEDLFNTVKNEMKWEKSKDGVFEHMDCTVHRLPNYIHTLKFPELSMNTIYMSALVRRKELKRDEAIKAAKEELTFPEIPPELETFLKEIGMSYNEFHDTVKDWRKLGNYIYKPSNFFRDIYHRFNRFM
jgi:tRNA(Ile)-lysidine synthase TilS/MesJ